ncbi:MAG: beta-ketoacyl-ACP synthase II [Bacteroidota bacterium]
MKRRVVVTGLGALTPIGNNVTDYWNNLIAGKSGAAAITKFDTSKFKTKFACELKDFNPLDFLERSEARKMDLFSQYAVIAAQQAITDAGLDVSPINKDNVGVVWGSGNGGIYTFYEQMMEFAKGDGTPRFNPFFIPKIIVDIASGWISIKNGYRGINHTTVSACASSNTAIADAYNYICWNKADAIITGGSEAAINPSAIGGFNACMALSTNNNEPTTASRPFDVKRDGFVMGEGAGALVLEELEHAKKRGAKIYAEVVGEGMSADAFHLTATHPEGAGAILGMTKALKDAGISADKIDYLNAHATSTPLGDISELKATYNVFGANKNLTVGATKSMTGHLLGAAGAIEAIASILAVKNNIIPPTINTSEPDAAIPQGMQISFGKAIEKKVDYAMSNTFGFGGHNATTIFKKFEE